MAAGVARLDDRGELTSELITAAPASAEVDLAPEAAPVTTGPGRVAVVPDKAAAQAAEWEAASYAAAQVAYAAEAARRATTTTAPAPPSTAGRAPAAESAPGAAPTPRPNPPAPTPPSGGGNIYAKLDNIAECESHKNPKAYNPAGPWYGAFQFHISTWKSLGESGDPRNRSYGYQREVAKRLQQRSGWNQWPDCSKQYGY